MTQPIVIMGGILSYPGVYHAARATLARLIGQPVTVVAVQIPDWRDLFVIIDLGVLAFLAL